MGGIAFIQGFFSAAVTVVLAAFFSGAWLIAARRNEPRVQALVAVLWSVGFWLLALAFLNRPDPSETLIFWTRCMHAMAPVVPMALLWLAASYLPKPGVFREIRLPLALAAAAAAWFAYISGLVPFLSGSADSGRVVLAAYFIIFAIAALVTLVVAARLSHEEEGRGLAPILFGAAIIISVVFNLMFGDAAPTLGGPWVAGSLLVAGLLIMTVFVADLKMLVDLRLVGAELLVLLVLGLFMSDLMAVAGDWFEFAFRFGIFILLLVFGGMMTRSLVRDVQRLHLNEELHEQLIRLNGRLIEADRQKTKYVSFVAHQLQSPLAGVHIYLNMAREGQFGPLSDELSGIIETNMGVLDRLLHTVQTFLNVTKIELGKVDLVKMPVSAGDLVARVFKEMAPLAERKGLKLMTDIDPNLPDVYCDPTYIFHVLANLVDNAIKYTARGSVLVAFRAVDDQTEFRVVDTGMGLTPSDSERLFNVFERGVSAVNMEAKGEGLGLYIIKQFVEAHGGKIFFESAGPGQGSTFGFRLPGKKTDAAL